MMTPRSSPSASCSCIAAAARRQTLTVPTMLMLSTFWNASSGSGPLRETSFPGVATPAQLTTTRRAPSPVAVSTAA